MPPTRELETALVQSQGHDREAFDRLVGLLYRDLRRVAHRQLRRLRPGDTLDTTGLVNEAYLKMVGGQDYESRAHFLNASARAMRHILVNAARSKLSLKRGGGQRPDTLVEEAIGDRVRLEHVLAVHRGLDGLAEVDERLCRVVECRYFAGMTELETATALGVSDRTVRRDWLRARAWLRREFSARGGGTES